MSRDRSSRAGRSLVRFAENPAWGIAHTQPTAEGIDLRGEAVVAPGVEPIAAWELERLGARIVAERPGAIEFRFDRDASELQALGVVNSVFVVVWFEAPRPLALLGDANFRRLLDWVDWVRAGAPRGAFQSFHLSAAGADSPALRRWRAELATATGLADGETEGDLALRLRRPLDHSPGWEVLIRLTPRPLATRAWRVCNWPGALNANIARAMAWLSEPQPDDVYLNLGCGSGTLLVERLAIGPAQRVIGCDTDAAVLACAAENLAASGYAKRVELEPWDARALPAPDRSVDVIVADLPFGQLVGSHADNVALYPPLLKEAARVAKPGARGVFITHEARLLTGLLEAQADWRLAAEWRLDLGQQRPRIYELRRANVV